jgi:ABC-type multidrug transport system ATPase subunit
MIGVTLCNTGKKFGREWIFRGIGQTISEGSRTVILGGNGSGKSTLLQIISGYVTPTEGSVEYSFAGTRIDSDTLPARVSLAAPYLQLIEDFTLEEHLAHAFRMKKPLIGAELRETAFITGLDKAYEKPVRQFSSGMKQRLRLALAILSDTPLLLLDEPVSNLDRAAIDWFHNMMERYAAGRTVIVCSNAMREEHFFCDKEIDLNALKAAG